MYQIFSSMATTHPGVMTPPNWHYCREGLARNLHTVVTYYRDRPLAVRSEHFLVTLIQSINVSLNHNLERYVDIVSNNALRLSMVLKMTSSIYRGSLFDGVFYGKGNPEILIATDLSFDIYKAQANWRHLSPISVLRHPVTSLGLALPDGKAHSQDRGYSVLTINIPLLALMYREWVKAEEQYSEQMGTNERSIAQFVHSYLLPNMMGSHLDYVLFNRLRALKLGIAIDTTNVSHLHPFHLSDYSDRLNLAQTEMLNLLSKSSASFADILQSIPLVHKPTLEKELHLPDVAPTFQVMWALSVARLPALEFLCAVSERGPGQRNRQEVSEILFNIRNYRRNSMMKTLPPNMQQDIESEMDKLIQYSNSQLVKTTDN